MSPLWLIAMVLVPAAFGLIIAFGREENARGTALVGSFLSAIPVLGGLFLFDYSNAAAFQGRGTLSWIPEFGLDISIGIDSVSLLLIALSALLGPICVGASWTAIKQRKRSFYAWLLILQGAMIGVFCARDLMLFYICFEFTLLPMFVLIRQYGSDPEMRIRAATKFFLYTFTGSLLTLAGLVYVAWIGAQQAGAWSLDIGYLTGVAQSMNATQQSWVLAALLAGFAVKVPLFPVHTWLPLAHTEAPTAGSVILAGVLLKLGTYGFFRFAMMMTPGAFAEHAPMLAVLAIIGVIYAGLICWVQTDVKKLVAYSSVSHLGFCVLGLLAANRTGVNGSVLYMLSHGLSTGALFLMIGFMYERYHTRDMRQVGGLASKMPVWATFMVFFTMASVGLPGLNGFPSELLCLIGTFQSDAQWVASGEPGAEGGLLGPWYAAIAATGMIVAAIYLLYMVGKICFGSLREPEHHAEHEHELPADLTRREIAVLVPLAVGCVFFGLYPKALTDPIAAPVDVAVQTVLTGHTPDGPITPAHTEPEHNADTHTEGEH
ncbi:MAG: NADH-quinone oxidoreductase subunit M [Phycisphaeraceae bacterium]|nr:MAG: NADH-quinone oxidoreductase subunit M [Phycisphaeraceae bacterium]